MKEKNKRKLEYQWIHRMYYASAMLRRLRNISGFNQKQIAFLCKLSQSTISRIERKELMMVSEKSLQKALDFLRKF